ncbi:hypothetical protein G6F43_013023 [Rhizopus delemar]|nr:hypothetical protein G6F43_013023 [Rhizopus delemar]
MESDTSPMEMHTNEIHTRRTDGCGRSSTEVSKLRDYRTITFSKQKLPFEFLYSPRTKQTQTNIGLHQIESVHTMSPFQDGRCSSTKRDHRERRLHMQNRFKRCICSCTNPREFKRFFDVLTSRNSLQVPIPRIWIECSSKDFLEDYEICFRTSQENWSSLCLLPGRHLCISQDERRDDESYPTNDSSLRITGISNQQGEEHINPEQSTIIPRFSIRYSTYDDSSPKGKNTKTGDKDSTTVENYKTSVMQVDSELDWEDNSDDTCSGRSTSPCQIHATGFSEGTSEFKPQLGISLLPEHNKPPRIEMVHKQGISQERASNTIQAAKSRYHHLRRCIGFRLGSQFSVSTNRRILDKKRKRRKHQCQRVKSNMVRHSTTLAQIQKLNPEDLLRQSNSSKILEQSRRNVISTTSGLGNTDPRLMQQIERTSDLQSHSGNTECRSRPPQSTETASVRMVLTNEMVQIPPIRVESS